MDNIYKASEMVLDILETNPESRNSDDYLYSIVCEQLSEVNGIDYDKLTQKDALLKRKLYHFPSYVTVCRVRRKLQAKYPNLAGIDEVEAQRAINEDTYKEYARS